MASRSKSAFKKASKNEILLPLLLSAIGLLSSVSVQSDGPAGDVSEDYMVVEARAQTKAFAQGLKETLMQGMKSEGPLAAIQLCNTEAPDIAAAHSKDGWEVGRTSEKLRNPNNAPDEWESAVLESFAQRAAAGEPLATMEASSREGGTFRYMKAIPVGGPCVVCHGEQLAEPVATRLSELYPEDNARGYQPGDLRGAFTLTYTFEKQ